MPPLIPTARAILIGACAALALSACKPKASATPPAPSAAASGVSSAASVSDDLALQASADKLLAQYRQVIVLMDGSSSLPASSRAELNRVGKMLFQSLQESTRELLTLTSAQNNPKLIAALPGLLDRIEAEPSWFDADRLAFREFLTEFAAQYENTQTLAGLKLAKRAQEDLTVLAEVQKAYDRELKETFGRLNTRGIELKREKWANYLTKLRGLYSREQILKANGVEWAALEKAASAPAAATAASKTAKTKAPGKEAREVFGESLPPKTVVLTFDDGPHGRYTDEILDILKRYNATAVFFELGQNLGKVDASGKVIPGPGSKVAQRVLTAGHVLANHSFSHSLMTKLDDAKVRAEASDTEALLDQAGRVGAPLFRFPYGARNDTGLAAIEALNMRSMMWNVDSLDWSDPIPRSIAARVLGELEERQRGIVLFHDIHARTVEALPLVLEQLVAEGYSFATWQDGHLVVPEPKAPSRGDTGANAAAPGNASTYRESHALIIGIDQYKNWPRLQHAVRDASAVREALLTQFGFKPDNVTTLLDGEATRANILRTLNDKFGNAQRVKRDDRVFVFFAGHGSTRRLSSGREVGYLIPVDAGQADLQTDAIAMPQLQEVGESLAAKHALFVIDACYSGLGLTRGAASPNANFLKDNARRLGRQMMTAGGADQQVADDGPGGHSVFTWTLLQALAGKADLNNDGLITGTELAAYIAPAVSAIAHQTPAFGSLPGSEGGEFVFELAAAPEEAALSAQSRQLDSAASQMAKRIDDASNAKPGAAAVKVTVKGLDGQDVAISTSTARVETNARVLAQRANDRGLQLYKERRYDEAEQAFKEALAQQPRFALAANNLGFLFYKRGKPQVAARWYENAIEMDKTRALAYLNLGDAWLQAKDDAKAQKAFQSFVALAPKHSRSADIAAWLKQPDDAHRPKAPAP